MCERETTTVLASFPIRSAIFSPWKAIIALLCSLERNKHHCADQDMELRVIRRNPLLMTIDGLEAIIEASGKNKV